MDSTNKTMSPVNGRQTYINRQHKQKTMSLVNVQQTYINGQHKQNYVTRKRSTDLY